MGILFTILMGFLFTITMGILFTIVLGIQLTISKPMQRIVLVDDVITRGATMLGAASRLAEAYPEAEIRAFAMIRTMSQPEAFVHIEDPCLGHIRLHGDQTFRNP